MNSVIPKRIIQTGKNLDLPLLSKASAANIRLLNPDFEYLFFDDSQVKEFIEEQFTEYLSVFNSFSYSIQRYDFFRYLAVYHFGGFYLDLDVLLASSLTDLLEYSCVFPFEELTINLFLRQKYGMDWEIGNYAFGAAAGHPFLKMIIENCIKAQNKPEWAQKMMGSIPSIFQEEYYVLNTTGPGLITRTLADYTDAAKLVKVLFPEDVCDSRYWHRFGEYGVHLQEATWRKRKNIFRRRLNSFWERWRRRQLLKESLALGKNRSLEFKIKT